MKKTVAVLLTALTVFSLTACGSGGMSASEVYQQAREKLRESDSLHLSMELDLDMTMAGQKMRIGSISDLKMENPLGPDLRMDMKTDMTMSAQDISGFPEQAMTVRAYYADGFYYIDSQGMKFKQPMDLDAVIARTEGTAGMGALPEEVLKDITMTAEGEKKVLTFTADGDVMTDYVTGMMGQMESLMAGMGDSASLSINGVSGRLAVNKDGYFEEQVLDMTMSMTVQGQAIEMTVHMNAAYLNPGTGVTAELPADLDTYTEISG